MKLKIIIPGITKMKIFLLLYLSFCASQLKKTCCIDFNLLKKKEIDDDKEVLDDSVADILGNSHILQNIDDFMISDYFDIEDSDNLIESSESTFISHDQDNPLK